MPVIIFNNFNFLLPALELFFLHFSFFLKKLQISLLSALDLLAFIYSPLFSMYFHLGFLPYSFLSFLQNFEQSHKISYISIVFLFHLQSVNRWLMRIMRLGGGQMHGRGGSAGYGNIGWSNNNSNSQGLSPPSSSSSRHQRRKSAVEVNHIMMSSSSFLRPPQATPRSRRFSDSLNLVALKID